MLTLRYRVPQGNNPVSFETGGGGAAGGGEGAGAVRSHRRPLGAVLGQPQVSGVGIGTASPSCTDRITSSWIGSAQIENQNSELISKDVSKLILNCLDY
jgi:hypothetical protein